MKRENTIISILINNIETYSYIKENIKIEDIKSEINQKAIKAIFEEYEKENSNINSILDHIEDEELQNHLTAIMAEDYGITDNKKAIEDIAKKYEREKLENRRDEILELSREETDNNKRKGLSQELNDIILKLVKFRWGE